MGRVVLLLLGSIEHLLVLLLVGLWSGLELGLGLGLVLGLWFAMPRYLHAIVALILVVVVQPY